MEKKPKEYALEYAGFWVRLGAIVTDVVVLLLIYGIILKLVALIASFPIVSVFGLLSWNIVSIKELFLNPLFLLAALVIKISYFVGFWAWRGQTPGKMLLGIKAIRTDSSPVTLGQAFLRYLGYIVSALTLCIGFIWVAFDERKQGLHDKIADTYVVKLPVKQVVLSPKYARTGAGLA